VVSVTSIGITINSTNYGQNTVFGNTDYFSINTSYPWRGIKNTAFDHCACLTLTLTNAVSGELWYLDARTYDDGFAYRLRIPGTGTRHTSGDFSQWHFSKNDTAWFQEQTTGYEGVFHSSPIRSLDENVKKTIAMPVTVELSGGGFAMLNEADVYGYSGMTVRPDPNGSLISVFEDDPHGWSMTGTITSAWRTVVISADLKVLLYRNEPAHDRMHAYPNLGTRERTHVKEKLVLGHRVKIEYRRNTRTENERQNISGKDKIETHRHRDEETRYLFSRGVAVLGVQGKVCPQIQFQAIL